MPADPLGFLSSYTHHTGMQREVAELCARLAQTLAEVLPPGHETAAGFRKLLEAKDCFVRATINLPQPPELANEWGGNR